MSGFSDDGQWWWDGRAWLPSLQVVIPDLPEAQTDTARDLVNKRQRLREAGTVGSWPIFSGGVSLAVGLPLLFAQRRTFREYRLFQLDLFKSATMHLLGPDEPMVAGETSLSTQPFLSTSAAADHDLGVVISARHVLVLRMDPINGQPRWIGLATAARDVVVEAPMPFFSKPGIVVRNGSQRWWIEGEPGIMQRDPVVAAWRAAAAASARM